MWFPASAECLRFPLPRTTAGRVDDRARAPGRAGVTRSWSESPRLPDRFHPTGGRVRQSVRNLVPGSREAPDASATTHVPHSGLKYCRGLAPRASSPVLARFSSAFGSRLEQALHWRAHPIAGMAKRGDPARAVMLCAPRVVPEVRDRTAGVSGKGLCAKARVVGPFPRCARRRQ
jgi:hypothetical protein